MTDLRKPWIAVMDLNVTRTSPAGSCVLAQVQGLADEHDITVFSDRFDNPRPDRIRWVRIPLPQQPGFLKYIVFHLLAPPALWWHSRQRGSAPALVQATQGQYIGADICYPHFCHRAYLAHQWKRQDTRGLRRLLRWCSYRYNAFSEARAFRLARVVVAPSAGLVAELERTYPHLRGRTRQLHDPIDVSHFHKPAGFDGHAVREAAGVPAQAPLLCFAALGDFERKGLGVLLDAMAASRVAALHLLVVGGSAGEVALFTEKARAAGVLSRCRFVGFQKDVRPYFWISDLFVLPSTYETFSLVLIQAIAAGVPVVATALYGFDEYAVDGETAWLVERSSTDVARAIDDALADPARRARILAAAQAAVQRFSPERFVQAWRELYRSLLDARSQGPA